MRRYLFLFLVWGMVFCAYADQEEERGYTVDGYGEAVKSAYGNCVHTAYYDANFTTGRSDCGDKKVVASAPTVVPPQPAPTVVTQTVTISDADKILFEFNQAILTPAGIDELTQLDQKINESTLTHIAIVGYTDEIGKVDYNLDLSKGRAQAVKLFLIQKGINEGIITTDGYGPQEAAASPLCFSKYGQDPMLQIEELEAKLMSKKFKGKHLSKKAKANKRDLEIKLANLKETQKQLFACTAPDRRVVITVEHVEKTTPAGLNENSGKVNSSAPTVPSSDASAPANLAVPPLGQ